MLRRPLWTVVLALLCGSAALWGSSRATWAAEVRSHPGTGTSTEVWRTGAETVPMLVPLAVLALAGVAGSVAVGGWPRRLVGVVVALAGIGALGLGFFTNVAVALDFFPWGRVLAVLGGALLVLAGALTCALSDRLPRLGARYRSPDAAVRSGDSDEEMWLALSEGQDPTTDDR